MFKQHFTKKNQLILIFFNVTSTYFKSNFNTISTLNQRWIFTLKQRFILNVASTFMCNLISTLIKRWCLTLKQRCFNVKMPAELLFDNDAIIPDLHLYIITEIGDVGEYIFYQQWDPASSGNTCQSPTETPCSPCWENI